MSIRRFVAAGVGLALLAPLASAGSAGAAPAADPFVASARSWLLTQQEADGGFEVANYPGFETPDAVLALATTFQTGPTWDSAGARAAIQSLDNGTGKDPLDSLDDLAELSLTTADPEDDPDNDQGAARAAKIIALNAAPLGISPSDFDPSGDSDEPVDLLALLESHKQLDGTYSLGSYFNGVLFTPIALNMLDGDVPAGLVAQIKAAQRPDGDWDYTGTPDNEFGGNDVDTTSLALLSLHAAGLGTDDPAVAKALQWIASKQQASGAWQAFGSDDPNSTSMAAMALSDLHIDVTTPAWRATYGSPVTGTYKTPYQALRTMQHADGHIINASESFGINTFATSQTIQALTRQWFLAGERSDLISDWSNWLASPAGSPSPNYANDLASDALGPNPSIKSARVAGATTMVNSLPGRQAAAADLFKQAFNRTIDPSGRAYWSNKLLTISRPEMLSRLTGSSEFYRKAGGTKPAFVDAVYQSVLGRAADPSGRAYWISKLNDGRSVERVARSLVASTEYRRHVVNDSFDQVVDRAPTTSERDYWMKKIATTRVEVLLATLGGSIEFYELASA